MESATGENEKRLLAATVRDRLIGNRNTIQYRELLDKKIPTFLKNYLQNSVQKYIHTEEPFQFNNSKRFDFEYSKISELKNSLIKAFEEATIFSREELIEIINRTVSLQFNLLVKPNATLLKIFFKNKSERIQTEILQILEGLDDRRIFIKMLITNIKEFDQYHIVEEDFKNILDETYKKVYQDNFIQSFVNDIITFSDFLGMIHGYEHKKIDINLLKLLLVERNLNQYLPAFDIYSDTSIDIDKIALLLTNYLTNKKGGNSDLEDDDEIEKFMMVPFSDDQRDNFNDQGSKLYKNEIERSFENLNKNKGTFSTSNDNSYQINIEQSDTDRNLPKITNVWKDPLDMVIKRSNIEKQPDGPLHSLSRLIDEKDKKYIQKKIFDNDIRAYNEFIRQLEPIDSWKEAKKMIDNELVTRSIEPFSKEALRLGDLVFNRYFPKSH
jgi:hypothetical protein